jgi:acetate kinase
MPPDPASSKHVILCLNSGSSSLKFALYHLGEVEEVRLAHDAVERIGLASGHLWIRGEDLMIAHHTCMLLVSTAAAQHP